MTVDMLVLIVFLPELIFDDLCRDFDEGTWRVVRGLLLLVVSIGVCRWVADVRYAYLETSAAVPPVARAIRAAATSDSSFVIQVKGTNYWPLPYYLKGLSVGYGDYSGAENASVRLLEASGPDAPRVEGYKITPIELRANEVWWLLVRKDIQLGQ